MANEWKIGPIASDFILAVSEGKASEIACFGPRGEAKTISALVAMGLHATNHAKAKLKTPVKWFGVTETFATHKAKTHESLLKDFWQGAWSLEDGGHRAIMRDANRTAGVLLELFGVEDEGALDRMRAEACCMWVDEPAPASTGPGVSLRAWETGISSLRIPTFRATSPESLLNSANVAVFTSNAPAIDHWTWRRFKPSTGTTGRTEGYPERLWFRIPVGDNPHLPAGQRERTLAALSDDRTGLTSRLALGEPGEILLGAPVAAGFSKIAHVADGLRPEPGVEIAIGFDGGHCPTAVIGQQTARGVKVFAAPYVFPGGMEDLLDVHVLPWLSRNAPWTLRDSSKLLIGYDPSLASDNDRDINSPSLSAINERLGFPCCEPGPVRWPARSEALTQALRIRDGLIIDSRCEDLIAALHGRWYFPVSHIEELRADQPKKPNHPWEDLGDSLIYLLCRFGVVGSSLWSPSENSVTGDVTIERNLSHYHENT